ncbi:MAG: hypothetical protein AAFY53_02810 [Pseudomonadota bacterium]
MTYLFIAIATAVLSVVVLLALNSAIIVAFVELMRFGMKATREKFEANYVGVSRESWFKHRAEFEIETANGDPLTLQSPFSSLFRRVRQTIGTMQPGDRVTIHAHRDKPFARVVCAPLQAIDRRDALWLSNVLIVICCAISVGSLLTGNHERGIGVSESLELSGRIIVCATQKKCSMLETVQWHTYERCERQKVRSVCDWQTPRRPAGLAI